ncbi:hypothetical protein OY671_012128, partial [Metschnikowia pulcherrima]
AFRRAAAPAGGAVDGARVRSRGVGAEGDRGNLSAHGATTPRADRLEEPVSRGRRGPELRRQRPAAARGAVREHSDPAGGRRRRRRARRGVVRSASAVGEAACAGRARQSARVVARAGFCGGGDRGDVARCGRGLSARGGRGGVVRGNGTADRGR